MRVIALTGGIGSGKSTVARRLAEHGATVIDADAIAREVVQPGTVGLAAVVARFGSAMLDDHGELDRARLASHVFSYPTALAELNAIVHPLVGDPVAQLRAGLPSDAVLVYDVPLLAET